MLSELINAWWTRLLQAIYQGSLSQQEAALPEHETRRDYLWNTLGTSLWGFSFPLLTIIATQLVGVEAAGMFSMAFVTGTILMIGASYGVRNHQVSDIDEASSFSSYQLHRLLSVIVAFILGLLYISVRGYQPAMASMCTGVYVYKVIDAFADVHEGRLQQADKLYLAGISQTIRSGAVIFTFIILLVLSHNLTVASIAMAIVATASLLFVTVPLAYFETTHSRGISVHEVSDLFKQCLPVALALVLFNLIESSPKFVMEGMLAYENQLYFNALFFPAQGILLSVGFLYKPQLLRLASIWSNPRRRRRFDLIVFAVLGMVVLLTIGMIVFMGSVGIGLLSFVYGLDFERFRTLAILMIVAGGISAAIDFLYAIITVLRRGQDVLKLYALAFVASIVLPFALIALMGLEGAVISYLASMTLLLIALLIAYLHIRRAITRERNPFHEQKAS
ncbi:lipopolysaccharide biosynthesis protein [Collinsella sp. zg1085]|nr:lipopolysaccharide biosynthesis protein [Collinsella sp. zg1085]